VGVILSGTLYDGTAGLFAVKRSGGMTMVQNPSEALFPGMPESAIGNVEVDHVLPVREIAALLTRLAAESAGDSTESSKESSESSKEQNPNEVESVMSSEIEQINEVITRNQQEQMQGQRHGQTSTFTCPDCGGTLWQANLPALVQFRCHVGHIYSADGLVREQTEVLERSLWSALRVFADKALLMRQLARQARQQGDLEDAESLEEKARLAERHNESLRRVIEENGVMLGGDTPSKGEGRALIESSSSGDTRLAGDGR